MASTEANVNVPLEEFVPYDASVQWRLHDAYFAACGRAAWEDGDIPSFATSNYAMARQHAALFVELVKELENAGEIGPRAKVRVLEIGGGNGAFAANFLRALDEGTGPEGKRVGKRVEFVFTDYAAKTVQQAVSEGPLRAFRPRVVPGLFDLRRPGPVRTLEEKSLDGPFHAVFANYVACVAPLKIVRQQLGTWFEQDVRVSIEVADDSREKNLSTDKRVERLLADPTAALAMEHLETETRWREVDLDALFPDPLHSQAIRNTIGGLDEGVLTYPYSFVDCLRALHTMVAPKGLVLVADYGDADQAALAGAEEREAQHYGNAISHGVEFALFDALAPLLGMSVARTTDRLRSVHVAALRNAKKLPKAFAEAFQRLEIDDTSGEDALVWGESAAALAREDEYGLAARLYARCVALDPKNVDLRYRLADTAVRAGYDAIALEQAGTGLSLDVAGAHDFHFILGRVHYRAGRVGDAVAEYMQSLAFEPHHITWTNLGLAYEGLNDFAAAADAYREALKLEPSATTAGERLATIQAVKKKHRRR